MYMCTLVLLVTSVLITTPDTNQCATDNGGCDHTCTDLIPGHECSCDDEYVLENDGKTCSGK